MNESVMPKNTKQYISGYMERLNLNDLSKKERSRLDSKAKKGSTHSYYRRGYQDARLACKESVRGQK